MRTIGVVILCSFFSLCMSSCGRSYQKPILSQLRIVGGRTAREHSWPWIVSIRQTNIDRSSNDPGRAFCGGTLIKEKYVLTAAHCFYDINQSLLSEYFVVMGAHYINDTDSIRFPIKSIRLHEKYDHFSYLNDIALLELSCPVDLNNLNIGLICLPPRNESIYPYQELPTVVAGWGSLEENGSISYTLQQIELQIISNKNQFCVQQVNENRTQFCAGYIEGGKDACQGDSGGPLMTYDIINQTWNIAGIISYGNGCARAEYPGVYTRVSVFMDWIEKHTNSSSMMPMSITGLWLLFSVVMYFHQLDQIGF